MNKDKLIRIFTALVILLAILFFSVGNLQTSGIFGDATGDLLDGVEKRK